MYERGQLCESTSTYFTLYTPVSGSLVDEGGTWVETTLRNDNNSLVGSFLEEGPFFIG